MTTVITAPKHPPLSDLIARYREQLEATSECCRHPGAAVLRFQQGGGSLMACCGVCGLVWVEVLL